MKIFIICCLLFIHVNMCVYIMHMFIESPYFSYYVVIQGKFRVSIRVSGIRGFGFGDGLSPESVFGAVLGFDFGFRVRVHRDSTRSESTPLPSLPLFGGEIHSKDGTKVTGRVRRWWYRWLTALALVGKLNTVTGERLVT